MHGVTPKGRNRGHSAGCLRPLKIAARASGLIRKSIVCLVFSESQFGGRMRKLTVSTLKLMVSGREGVELDRVPGGGPLALRQRLPQGPTLNPIQFNYINEPYLF